MFLPRADAANACFNESIWTKLLNISTSLTITSQDFQEQKLRSFTKHL